MSFENPENGGDTQVLHLLPRIARQHYERGGGVSVDDAAEGGTVSVCASLAAPALKTQIDIEPAVEMQNAWKISGTRKDELSEHGEFPEPLMQFQYGFDVLVWPGGMRIGGRGANLTLGKLAQPELVRVIKDILWSARHNVEDDEPTSCMEQTSDYYDLFGAALQKVQTARDYHDLQYPERSASAEATSSKSETYVWRSSEGITHAVACGQFEATEVIAWFDFALDNTSIGNKIRLESLEKLQFVTADGSLIETTLAEVFFDDIQEEVYLVVEGQDCAPNLSAEGKQMLSNLLRAVRITPREQISH